MAFHYKLKKSNQSGQGVLEYVVLMVVISLGTIAILKFLGDGIRTRISVIALDILGASESQKESLRSQSDSTIKKILEASSKDGGGPSF